MLLTVLTLSALCATVLSAPAAEPVPGPKPATRPDVDGPPPSSSEPWIGTAKSFPDGEVHLDNPCAGGTPWYSAGCKKDQHCPAGFSCLARKDPKMANVCCLTEERVMPYMKCPGSSAPAANKFCHSDGECGEGKCHYEWTIPEELYKELSAALADSVKKDNRPLDPIGICCSKDDVAPHVLATCPSEHVATRTMPCGVALPSCNLGAECMYAQEAFGRCCLPKDVAAKIGLRGNFPLNPFGNVGSSSFANAASNAFNAFGLAGSSSNANAGSNSFNRGGFGGSQSNANAGSQSFNRGGFSGSQSNANAGSQSFNRGGFSGSQSNANAGSSSFNQGGRSGSQSNANAGSSSFNQGGRSGSSSSASAGSSSSGGGFGGTSSFANAGSSSGSQGRGGSGSSSFANAGSSSRSFGK